MQFEQVFNVFSTRRKTQSTFSMWFRFSVRHLFLQYSLLFSVGNFYEGWDVITLPKMALEQRFLNRGTDSKEGLIKLSYETIKEMIMKLWNFNKVLKNFWVFFSWKDPSKKLFSIG